MKKNKNGAVYVLISIILSALSAVFMPFVVKRGGSAVYNAGSKRRIKKMENCEPVVIRTRKKG
ncbi:MAG: hypothetical protein IJJ57_07720 [Ruminococcus sp.]|nr:hypothetical protein [Ruminococcus sp.]